MAEKKPETQKEGLRIWLFKISAFFWASVKSYLQRRSFAVEVTKEGMSGGKVREWMRFWDKDFDRWRMLGNGI